MSLRAVLILSAVGMQVHAQMVWFPGVSLTPGIPADPAAHTLKIENIVGKRDLRAIVGSRIPYLDWNDYEFSLGTSVHFDVQPAAQTQVVSTEFYVDFIDVAFIPAPDWILEGRVGHTSHHLADNAYERLGLSESVNYSRDYVDLRCFLRPTDRLIFVSGANYGYRFHADKNSSKWQPYMSAEYSLFEFPSGVTVNTGGFVRSYGEDHYRCMVVGQFAIVIPTPTLREVRVAYQFRTGPDDRGQFFPHHRQIHTVGFLTNL